MLTPTRVYVSVPNNQRLSSEQLDVKKGILKKLGAAGFESQELKISGDLAQIPWSFENVQYKLGRCQGALVLGLIRWDVWNENNKYKFITAYNHFEGALALAENLPIFILMHEDAHKAGIVLKGRSPYFVKLPNGVDSSWFQSELFLSTFNAWVEVVRNRHHIFLGYSSKNQATARKIKDWLTKKGVSIMDGVVDIDPATPMRNEVERASKSCMGGFFLFTKDDEMMTGDSNSAASRDGLVFATGYFMNAKGTDKILIILEEGARTPADISGLKCLSLPNRDDISPIEKDLEKFIINNL